MRIALNARILQAPRTGIGHYVAELVNALHAETDIEVALFHGWAGVRNCRKRRCPVIRA